MGDAQPNRDAVDSTVNRAVRIPLTSMEGLSTDQHGPSFPAAPKLFTYPHSLHATSGRFGPHPAVGRAPSADGAGLPGRTELAIDLWHPHSVGRGYPGTAGLCDDRLALAKLGRSDPLARRVWEASAGLDALFSGSTSRRRAFRTAFAASAGRRLPYTVSPAPDPIGIVHRE